jgi:UV DNA damage endonuclease
MTATPPSAEFGLVCVTSSDAVRFRTITRTNYLKLEESARHDKLRGLYRENFERLLRALEFCRAHDIHLYRMTSQLFPMSDLEDGVGAEVLAELAPELATVGRLAEAYGIRVVVHPDQFVVLSSDSPAVVENSVAVLGQHARNLDLMGLPRSAWSVILIHGGKGGRTDQLAARVPDLPEGILSRLAFENDEHAYSAADILDVCRRTGRPFVFDAHHHVINQHLTDYDDPSVEHYVQEARTTWSPPDWQIVHLSNGREGILDRRHSDLIDTIPAAYAQVRWIEVEAKGKEEAILALRGRALP